MENTERQLKAIMFSDVKSFSAMMGADEARTVRLVKEHREVVRAILGKHHGEEHGTAGDSFFVLFASAVEAVQCAVEIQEAFHRRNAERPLEEQIWIRIGIHLGDILVDRAEHHVYGDGINIAARTEPMAEPGGICITRDVYQQVYRKLEVRAVSIGRKEMKNILDAPELYQLMVGQLAGPKGLPAPKAVAARRRPVALILGIAAIGVVGIGAGAYAVLNRAPGPDTPAATGAPAAMTLTVLPFDNVAKSEAAGWMSLGLSQGIADSLHDLKGLTIKEAPREAALASLAKRTSGDALSIEAGKQVGARWVVAGSFTAMGSEVRATAKVLVTDTGRVLKVVTREGRADAVLALQRDLTQDLLKDLLLDIQVIESDFRLRSQTTSEAAYAAMSRYRTLYRRDGSVTDANFDTLNGLLNEAIRHDPEYAEVYRGISSSHLFLGISKSDSDLIRKALGYADTYIQKRPDDPFAYSHRSRILMFLGAYSRAIADYEHARSLNPDVYYEPGLFEAIGQMDREERIIQERVRQSGAMYWPTYALGGFYLRRGEYGKAKTPVAEAVRIHDESLKAGEDSMVKKAGWVEPVGAHQLEGELRLLTGDRAGANRAFQAELEMLEGRAHSYKGTVVATCHAYLALIAELDGDAARKAAMEAALAKDLADGGANAWMAVGGEMILYAGGEARKSMLQRGRTFVEKAVADTGRKQPFFLDMLAETYERLGMAREARSVDAEGQALLPECESFGLREKRLAALETK